LRTSHHVNVDEKRVWAIKVYIEATEEEADEAVRAIGSALCPEENHPGYCPVPWATVLVPPDSLDPDELADWSRSFAEDRDRARRAGETGA
jgi:hypothetical protein